MRLDTGKVLNNRYRIVSLLGQGGFGAVYRAWDLNLKRPCAVKENLEINLQGQKQFENEATILANLYHQHLPRVTDHFVLPNQGQYLVMDFVEGKDLDEMVSKGGPLPTKQAVEWISQIADALVYLHTHKPPVIHRDIKPANIRVAPNDKAYLVDFGLVKLYDIQASTTPGARGVTPGFSPPEQYGHGGTNALSDIYSLAATLYTLVTGVVPPESVHRYANVILQPAHTLNPDVPPSLSAVIEKAMALDPGRRFQNVRDFKDALKKAIAPLSDEDTLITQRKSQTFIAPSEVKQEIHPVYSPKTNERVSSPPAPKKPSFFQKNKWLILGAAIMLIVLCGGSIYAFQFKFGESDAKNDSAVAEDIGGEELLYTVDTEISEERQTPLMTEGIDPTVFMFTETPTLVVIDSDDSTLTPTDTSTAQPSATWTPTPFSAAYDLAFASDRDGEFKVYLMNTATREVKSLPRPSGYERIWWPSFCGSSIAVEAQDIDSGDQWVYLIDILSGDAERVSSPSSAKNLGVPRCAPGGGYLAYSADVGDIWALFVTDFSSTVQIIPDDGYISGYASWSLQGMDFLFQVITQDNYENEIYHLKGDLSNEQYKRIDVGANPSLSPDGSKMIYSCKMDENNRILCLANLDGSDVTELIKIIRIRVPGVGWSIQPASAWSADGQWIYFASAIDGDWDIYRIRPNGNDIQNLTEDWGSSNEVNPALNWQN